jgi:hypothetical protein
MAYTKYSLTPADNNAAPPNGAPEGMLPSGVNDTMRDMMSQIRDVGDGIRGGTYTMTAPVITGGSVSGITDLAIADGGTGASTAANARVNLGVDNFGSMKNRIINGAMVIDQRNAGASVTNDSADLKFAVDRTNIYGAVSSKFTAQQNAGSVTPPVGFTNYLGCTSSSAYTVGAGENFWVQQRIEGYNVADLGWGTANAKTVTLSFWVRSSLTGTFGGSFQNSASDRSYPFSYTISAANTWEQKTITVAGDTTGTWLTTNGLGLKVTWGIGVGSTFSGTAGAWVGSNINSVTGATSVVGTNGATFYITGVQLEVGTQATGFEYRQYTTEFQLCQRYYQKLGFGTGYGASFPVVKETTNTAGIGISLPVSLRASPSVSVSGANRIFGNGSQITLATSVASTISTTNPAISNIYILQTASAIADNQAYVLYIDSNNFYNISAEL